MFLWTRYVLSNECTLKNEAQTMYICLHLILSIPLYVWLVIFYALYRPKRISHFFFAIISMNVHKLLHFIVVPPHLAVVHTLLPQVYAAARTKIGCSQ